MKVLIIEDETPAAEKLERYLHRYDEQIEIQAVLKSVKESIEWLKENEPSVDLIFMDIQLLDGKSFEIFDQVDVQTPVIFTTAYDEYAVEAFKVNSVGYLMKPITFKDLEAAMSKADKMATSLSKGTSETDDTVKTILKELRSDKKAYKNRFMVKIGDHIKSIPAEDIKLFYAEGRDAYLISKEDRKFIVDFNLEQLEGLLDPRLFQRVNRTFILNINSIKDVVVYSNSRLKVIANYETERDIIISREKVPAFKSWIDGNPA